MNSTPGRDLTGTAQSDTSTSLHTSAESRFAYVFYATANRYCCSVLVNIHRLRGLNSSVPIHVLVSADVDDPFIGAMERANANVHMLEPPAYAEGEGGYYRDCLLKLLAFKLHMLVPGLHRILVLDADQPILKNMDSLFEGLPDVDLAAPRAYWLSKDFLATTFMMINLSDRLWETIRAAFEALEYNKFDMDLVNDVLGDTVMMLSGEYVTLNSHWENWDLPQWFHPTSKLEATVVKRLNDKPPGDSGESERQVEQEDANGQDRIASEQQVSPSGSAIGVLTQVPIPAASLATSLLTPVVDEEVKPKPVPLSPSPRFSDSQSISKQLYQLQEFAPIIHFSALGKPWMLPKITVTLVRPDAHPLLAQQFEMWHETAAMVCPDGILL
ncbi:hypothetical protein LTR37_017594 [Vermiconidia calcicola]|uniref:Uncharacterized protein n=1 Tax=Vermiconidia calcicola TaxID=1690605 RepID=A0ACC3MMA5_9PEZI|nr:hypothetical protein LTR37_017594 [Vermiconidia calcicola]